MRFILLIIFVLFASCVWARRPFLRPLIEDEADIIKTDVVIEKVVAENPLNNLAENEDDQASDAINTFQYKEEENNPSALVTTIRPKSWPWSNFVPGTRNTDVKIIVSDKNEEEGSIELLPYEVLEKTFNYELRSYGKSKWACTTKIEDLDEDPFLNWRLKYRDGWEALRKVMKSKETQESMFTRLYKYIIGVNSEATEIDMSRPVVTKRVPLVRNRERLEMCFWTGSEWKNKVLPDPLKNDVYIMEIPAIQVYVREFSGFALSHQDWEDELINLVDDLKDKEDVDNSATFYTASYDGHWTEGNERRNEVWLLKVSNNEINKPSGSSTLWNQNGNFQAADEQSELLSHEVLETNENYEVRRYPATKWACTKEYDVDPLTDPMRNWETKYGNSPMQAMSGTEWKGSPSSKMFMRLFRYILGVNEGSIEIEMTRPVPTKVIPLKRSRTTDQEMCFWLGTPYESEDAPRPIDRKVTIEEKSSMIFYVRQFNGYAFSYQDWEGEYKNLRNDLLLDENVNPDLDVWYHIGYDSPWTPANQRRNEIWIPYNAQVAEENGKA